MEPSAINLRDQNIVEVMCRGFDLSVVKSVKITLSKISWVLFDLSCDYMRIKSHTLEVSLSRIKIVNLKPSVPNLRDEIIVEVMPSGLTFRVIDFGENHTHTHTIEVSFLSRH